MKYMLIVSENLKIDIEQITKALLYRTREINKQVIESPMNKADCNFARDSLSKDLFDKLFNWLVKRLNFTILPEEDLETGFDLNKSNDRLTIGLLDIFGFEVFKINSLEQFCINFTNEKLQQLYIA